MDTAQAAQKKSTQTTIQADISEFFSTLKNQANLLPTICSVVRKIDLYGGISNWVSVVGSQKRMTVVVAGTTMTNVVDEVEKLDTSNRSITFNVIQGPILARYKTFKVTLDVALDRIVTWTVEYKKTNSNVPDPDAYLNSLATVTDIINKYLTDGI